MYLYSFSVRFITNPKRDEIYSRLLTGAKLQSKPPAETSSRHIEAAKILLDLISGADRIDPQQVLP